MTFAKADQMLSLARMASASRQGVSISDVMDRFAVSRRTAQRMLRALEAQFLDTEASIDHEGRKRWRLQTCGLHFPIWATAEELAAFDLATQALIRTGAHLDARHMRELRDKLNSLVPRTTAARLETDHEALLEAQGLAFRPGPRSCDRSDITSTLSYAIRACAVVKLRYRRQDTITYVSRTVAPYGFITGIRRYLVACKLTDKAAAKPRLFVIDNIKAVTTCSKAFVRAPFDVRSFCERSFGIYQSEAELSDVVLRFSKASADRVRNFVFHPTQTMEDLKNGCVVVRFRAAGLLEMTWHLYMWGCHVEVLAPETLRDMVHPYRRKDFFLGP